jgi:hypothetical protein
MTSAVRRPTDQQVGVVAAHVRNATNSDVLTAALDGQEVLIAFDLNAEEHQRRKCSEAGPIHSRGLLHALWSLPEELPTPVLGLDDRDRETLTDEGQGFVRFVGDAVYRDYRPPGVVLAVALVRSRLAEGVTAIGAFPPLFRRYAVATNDELPDPRGIALGEELGIGMAAFTRQGFVVLSKAAAPWLGVPAVYRWWLAEISYSAWVYANAH